MRWIGSVMWNWLIGAAMTLTPVTALIAMGWVQRRMSASVKRCWASVEEPPPHWFGEAGSRLSGLGENARAGVAVAIPLVLSLCPVWILWIVAWGFGWENSFVKGYERAGLGLLMALFGVAAFALLMTILPLAEARFAATREWRSFTDDRMLWAIARTKPFGTFALALAFLLCGLVVAGMKAQPLGIGNTLETAAQAQSFLIVYPLICALSLFPLYVVSRLAAARLYAQAILYPSSDRMMMRMTIQERQSVKRQPRRRVWATAPARFVWSGALLAGTLASWAAFAFVLYTAQFLAHDWAAWINHPLIQVPTVMSIFRAP